MSYPDETMRLRLKALVGLLGVLAAAWIGLSLCLPSSATARDAVFVPGFSADTHLGEAGTLSMGFMFSGSEYHGQVAPISELRLRLPEGIGFTSGDFPTCSKATLLETGPIACPPGSMAGALGSLRAIVYFPEAEEEEAEVFPFFGPDGVLYFLVSGHFPVALELLMEGHLVSDGTPPYGQDLVITVPEGQQTPQTPVDSVTAMTLNLGTTQERGGQEVSSLTLPSSCSGSLLWDAELSFNHEASEALETFSSACPASGERATTASTVTASKTEPHETETVTYTATVTPTNGGPVPTGTVTFSDSRQFLTTCTAVPLSVGASSATATCQVTYGEPIGQREPHAIRAQYTGNASDRGSLSHPLTIEVLDGPPPPEAPHHTEESQPSSGGSTTATASSIVSVISSGGGSAGTISTAMIVAALKQLVPSGTAATIPELLKHGGVTLSFMAPEAGRLSVQWYYTPRGAKVATAKLVLVATGTASFTSAGAGQLTVKLTTAGRRVLKQGKRVSLTVKRKFAPTSGIATDVTSRVVVGR
jgi:hypothetical protein